MYAFGSSITVTESQPEASEARVRMLEARLASMQTELDEQRSRLAVAELMHADRLDELQRRYTEEAQSLQHILEGLFVRLKQYTCLLLFSVIWDSR